MPIKRIGKGFEFGGALNEFNSFKMTAPKIIANQSVNHFKEGFRKGGFQTDASKTGWQPRNARKKTVKRNAESPGKKPAKLLLEGSLMGAVQVLSQTFSKIIIGTQRIDYAERHNEGITDKYGRKMPKREFIGESAELNEKNTKKLASLISKIFK